MIHNIHLQRLFRSYVNKMLYFNSMLQTQEIVKIIIILIIIVIIIVIIIIL